MRIVRTVQAMRQERTQWTSSLGLVPTMGYLHAGHLSLVQQARAENEHVIVSIFVNPTQFGPHEDLTAYPKDIERDLQMLEALHVDTVFLPTPTEMYPAGFTTYVTPEGSLVELGEGAVRPGHFRGVATVVLKLFQITQPTTAYFGQKDAQQVAVIARMITDLNVPVALRVLPTMREADGLAMSSRNSYLNPTERARATIIYRALKAGQEAFTLQHETSAHAIIQAMQAIIAQEPAVQVDYIEIRNPSNFEPYDILQAPALILIAVRIGATRLIDNFTLQSDGTWNTGRAATYPATAHEQTSVRL
jgi:pantoate--beta-alanine ligase